MVEGGGESWAAHQCIFHLLDTVLGTWRLERNVRVLCLLQLLPAQGAGLWGRVRWGISHAKDGVQSVGLVLVPVAKLCLSQFQDHIRVTLGFR